MEHAVYSPRHPEERRALVVRLGRPILAFALAALSARVSLARDIEGVKLPAENYATALRKAGMRKEKIEGLEMKVSFVGDAYRYRMAQGIEELRARKYSAKALESKLRALHRKHKARRGDSLFLVALSRKDSNTYWFFQGPLEKHVEVRTHIEKSAKVKDLRGKPKPQKWQVWETQPDDANKLNKLKNPYQTRALYPFFELDFAVRVSKDQKKRRGDAGAISLKLQGLVTQRAKGSTTNSVNAGRRQISCRNFKDLFRDKSFHFERDAAKRPTPPKEFEELLEWLEEN